MEQAEELLSTVVLKQGRLWPKISETAAQIKMWHNHASNGTRHLWWLDQATDIKSRVLAPIRREQTPDNILLAIWSMNRAVKRRRDAAEATYEGELRGFAGAHQEAKDRCYRLKDIGIAWLAHNGHLATAYRPEQLVVRVGDGYIHSTLIPHGAELTEAGDNLVRMEASGAAR